MTAKHALIVAAAAGAALWPSLAGAQEGGGFTIEEAPAQAAPKPIFTNQVELGFGWLTGRDDVFKYGEYTGHEDTGPFGIGALNLHQRPNFEGDSTEYWDISGTNLGLESRSLRGEYGQQGSYKLYLFYDQIPHFVTDTAKTPFDNAGTEYLTLPANFVKSGRPFTMTTLDSNLKSFDVETERKRFGGGFTMNLTDEWSVKGDYKREYKDGVDTIGAAFGTNGGNTRSIIAPLPIDQTTDQMDVSVGYTGQMVQGELSYHLSLYNDNIRGLTWIDPYGTFLSEQGQLGVPPDNSAHQIMLSGGMLLDEYSRLAGSFAYGRMLQDDNFLPYSVKPSFLTTPLPRDSLDGRIDTMHGNLTFTTMPFGLFDFRAGYTFDDRDNKTPRDVYLVVQQDSAAQGVITSGEAKRNRPYSLTTHTGEVEAGYRIIPEAKVSGGYKFEHRRRTFSEVDENYEHTEHAKLSLTPSPYVNGWLQYQHAYRTASAYVTNQAFLDGHSQEHIDSLNETAKFENDPDLVKFYEATRGRHKVSGTMHVMPMDMVTLGFTGAYVYDFYPNSPIGLNNVKTVNLSTDVTYQMDHNVSLSAFFAADRNNYNQRGYDRTGGAFPPGAVRTDGRFWTVSTKDRVFTAGASAEWWPIPEMVDVKADYMFSRAITTVEGLSNGALRVLPLPDIVSRLHSFGISGGYKITENATIRLGYRFEWFKSNDFALDGVYPGSINETVGLGNESPDYTVHLVGVTAVYNW